MNYWWLSAGIVCFITALIHTFMGQKEAVVPFLKSNLDSVNKAIFHVGWHMVTAVLFTSTIALVYVGFVPQTIGAYLVCWFIGINFVLFALLFLGFSLTGKWSNKLFRLPQWTLLLLVGVLAILG